MKLYIGIAGRVLALFFLAYFVGVRDGKNRCVMRASENIAQQQIHLINLQEKINAETVRSNTGDIRRILREKYTIAE